MKVPAPVRSGWLPDPTGRFEERYAIRGTWTRRVRVGDAEAIDTVAAEPEVAPGASTWESVAPPEAEWRPDPTGRFQQRWWDGGTWTRKVRNGPAVATDVAAAPPAPRRGRRRVEDREPPGWRADPSGRGQRYWNGHDWTAKWRPGPRPTDGRLSGGWWPRRLVAILIGLLVLALALIGAVVWLW